MFQMLGQGAQGHGRAALDSRTGSSRLRREIDRLDRELGGYIDSMIDGMGRPERRRAMGAYITGLLLDGERKSVQPARLVDDVSEIEAMRQRLQQAVCVSPWSDFEMWTRLAQKVDRE